LYKSKKDNSHRKCGFGKPSAIWGELTSRAAKKKGIAGTIILGYARDIDVLSNIDYPVFSYGVCPNAGSPLGKGETNLSLDLGYTKINPGDFIFADKSGVVVVPQDLFQLTMKNLIGIKTYENEIKRELKENKPFPEILGLR